MKLRLRKVHLAVALALLAASLLAVALLRRPVPLTTASGRALTPLCAAAVRSVCQKRVACGQMDRGQLEVCVEEWGAECERSLGWKLRAGVLFSPAGEPQEECLEAIGEASCNALQFMLADDEPNLFEITNRCELAELLQPRAGLGDPCAETSDCTAGYCPGLAPECHRCQAYLAEGEPCQAGLRVCDPVKTRCAAGSDGAGRCVALVAGAPPGAPCRETGACAAGLYCTGGACAPRIKTGEPCAGEAAACAEQEASCVAGKCQVRPFSLREGEACREFSDCRPGLFCRGARRQTGAGRCAPQAAVSQACDSIDFGGCSAEAACVQGRCRRLAAAGESCAGPFLCKGFLSCVPAAGGKGAGTCVPHSVAGQPCTPSLACAASFCDAASGTCLPLAAGGQPCRVSEQCESHWCVTGPSGGSCYAPCAASPGAVAQ